MRSGENGANWDGLCKACDGSQAAWQTRTLHHSRIRYDQAEWLPSPPGAAWFARRHRRTCPGRRRRGMRAGQTSNGCCRVGSGPAAARRERRRRDERCDGGSQRMATRCP